MFTCTQSCRDMCVKYADIAPLVLRLAMGLVFFMHGWQKLTVMGVPGVSGFLEGLGFPAPAFFAVVLIAVEIVGGLALIIGLYTHWAAKLAAIVAIVAWVTVHLKGGFFMQNGGYEFIMLIFAAAVSLMFTGAGKYSLDAKMMK